MWGSDAQRGFPPQPRGLPLGIYLLFTREPVAGPRMLPTVKSLFVTEPGDELIRALYGPGFPGFPGRPCQFRKKPCQFHGGKA